MALSRVKVWSAGEVLTASDLNAEFNNILNNVQSLINPITFNLLFTDATYDIGAAGATRPRDLHLSRNIYTQGFGVGPDRGHIFGLTMSNNATTTELDVSAGMCMDSTGQVPIILSAAITDGLLDTGAWVAGSNQKKLDTGAVANTSYHVFAIRKDSDGSGDFLISASATAPTMPTGYTYFRRIGSLVRVGGVIRPFKQFGDEFIMPDIIAWGVTGTTAGSLVSLPIPTGVKMWAMFSLLTFDATVGEQVRISCPEETDVAVTSSYATHVAALSSNYTVSGPYYTRTDTSGRVRERADAAVDTLRFNVRGWIDARGRYD